MRWWLGLGALFVAACLNPADYEDKPDTPPPPPADTAQPPVEDTVLPPEPDTSVAADATGTDTEDVPVTDASPPIDTPAASDTASDALPTNDTVPGDDSTDADDTAVDAAPSGSCVCQFSMAATSPTPQSFLWLTGDFLDPPWPETLEEGALPMSLDAITDVWTVGVLLEDGQVVAYKFRVGWIDNPGPVWRNQEGETLLDAPDSILTVSCGQPPCSEVP